MKDYQERLDIVSMLINDKLSVLDFAESVETTRDELMALNAPDAYQLVSDAAIYLVVSQGVLPWPCPE